jgi:ribosomal protein S18 acetylase RimI-like enzyme
MEETGIRPGLPRDGADIAHLVLLSAERFLPAVFGDRIGRAVRRLAAGRGTLFSHAHALVAEDAGRVVGVNLGYSGARKVAEDPATGLALLLALGPGLLRRLGRLLALQRTIGRVAREEWYVSNVAVLPECRGRGIGRRLMEAGEAEAARAGCDRIVLDVETDHLPAIGLYRSLGYDVTREEPPMSAGGTTFAFLRMGKAVVRAGGAPG